MSRQYREYTQPSVGQSGCTYSSLRQTYGNAQAPGRFPGMGISVVPKLCPDGPGPNYPPAYNTLSHGSDYLCGGYFSLDKAYPQANCTSCNAVYTTRACDGCIGCGSSNPYL